jgi:hypothetical protein
MTGNEQSANSNWQLAKKKTKGDQQSARKSKNKMKGVANC